MAEMKCEPRVYQSAEDHGRRLEGCSGPGGPTVQPSELGGMENQLLFMHSRSHFGIYGHSHKLSDSDATI
jgi:hypothetical protein